MRRNNNTKVGEVLSLNDFSTPDFAFSLNATAVEDGSVVLYKYERVGSDHKSSIVTMTADEFDQLAAFMGYVREE